MHSVCGLEPLMAMISLILLGFGEYESYAYQGILLTVYNISYTVALYYLFLFYLATRDMLKEHNTVGKFFAVKTIVFLTYWQMLAIMATPGLDSEAGEGWNDFILCIEMLFFALLHLRAFSVPDTNDSVLMNPSVLSNAKEVVSINDVVDDAYHNFAPKYQEYVLATNAANRDSQPKTAQGVRKFRTKVFHGSASGEPQRQASAAGSSRTSAAAVRTPL